MEKQEIIKKETETLLEKMGFESSVAVSETNGVFNIQIDDVENTSLLIGFHGATLRSVQTVLEAIFYNLFGESVNVVVNVADYREKQKERLEGIAENIANRVLTEGRPSSLPSFSAFERKLIHEYISANHPTLTSYSEGEGKERRLIVTTKSTENNS